MKDERIIYGFCTWWDSIDKAGDKGIPCCPKCKSNLFEMESIEIWNAKVAGFDYNHKGYKNFIDWLRGKCFKTYKMAYANYQEETGQTIENFKL